MNLFGKKKKAGPTLSESITQLREAMDSLDKREQHISKQIQLTTADARKKAKAKDKRGAIFQLKRKKMLEKQIDQIYGKKTNIELQIMTLESAAGTTEVLAAMRKGADALKHNIKEGDIEKVGDVMDEITESMALADELGDAMSQSIGPPIDEDELTAELEEMESEMVSEDLLKAPVVPVKEPAARAKPVAKEEEEEKEKKEESQEERELRELEASMGVNA